jgi:hypothetical protein
MKKLRAEGMDRLHFQPAGRLQRPGEQTPRQSATGSVGLDLGAGTDCLVEGGVIERGPFGKRVEHTLGHVGGGGLGESDAENFLGRDAFQEEVDDALRQNMRLARSSIGRDPSRHRGIGDGALQITNLKRDDVRLDHSPPIKSSVTPPELDHSFTRAR